MPCRRLDVLVRDVRDATGNKDYTNDSGVLQRVFVRHANDAQSRIFNRMMDEHPSLFIKQGFLDTVMGTASYALPTDIYLKHNISTVAYAPNGNAQLYSPLELRQPRDEVTINGYPTGYFLRDGNIVLTPVPSQSATSGLRFTYQYTLPTIDIRRGLVSAHGLTSITLTSDTTLISETEDDLTGGWVDYISVVDKDGVQVATAIPVTSYSSTTKIITCTLTAAQNSAVTNGSNYVVFGTNATTHSALLPICERYLSHYMTLLVQIGDSSSNATYTNPVLMAIEQEIIESIANLEEDIVAIPILDYSMLNYTDFLE